MELASWTENGLDERELRYQAEEISDRRGERLLEIAAGLAVLRKMVRRAQPIYVPELTQELLQLEALAREDDEERGGLSLVR